MNIFVAIRLIMALMKVLKVNLVELAAAYSDISACQAAFDELVKLAGETDIIQ